MDSTHDKPKKPSTKKIAAIVLAAVAVILIAAEATGLTQVISGFFNTETHFVEIAFISYDAGSNPQLHGTENGFFLVTRSSVRFHNADGAEIFRDSHALSNPVLFGRGEFAAIVEQNGSVVQVYNTSGLIHRIVMDAPVISLTLGLTGCFAAIMHTDDAYIIRAFDNTGREGVGGPHHYPNIVPMLIDFSHDGGTLALSYLDINEAQINSTVSFMFARRNDYLAHGHLVFASSLFNPGQIIGAMRFMACGNLVAISDTRIFAIEPSSGITLWEIPIGNRITWFYIGRDWIAVMYADALLNRSHHPPGTIAAYSSGGEPLFANTLTAGSIDAAALRGNAVVVGIDGYFTALSRGGAVLWNHTLPNNVVDIAMIGDSDRIVAASPTEAVILRRVRIR